MIVRGASGTEWWMKHTSIIDRIKQRGGHFLFDVSWNMTVSATYGALNIDSTSC